MNSYSDDKELTDAVLAATKTVDGKIKLSCADAFKIAAELNVSPAEVGRICNERDIKVTRCQLGCF